MDFDPDKDKVNLAKHRISLARASDMEIIEFSRDERFDYGEICYRAWGYIDRQPHFLAFVVRNGQVRPISLRRAHVKEMKRYAKKTQG